MHFPYTREWRVGAAARGLDQGRAPNGALRAPGGRAFGVTPQGMPTPRALEAGRRSLVAHMARRERRGQEGQAEAELALLGIELDRMIENGNRLCIHYWSPRATPLVRSLVVDRLRALGYRVEEQRWSGLVYLEGAPEPTEVPGMHPVVLVRWAFQASPGVPASVWDFLTE